MEREKVLKGLAACRMDPDWAEDCRKLDCPYCGEGSCVALLANDAYRLLMEQEPRVMTLEEVREIKPFILWVEDMDTGTPVFPVAYIDGEYRDRAYDWAVCFDWLKVTADYGKRWRCWTSRPTDAQREAVKWE